ncbi:MAG: aldolase/citrate lyase family protein [Bacteroidota bacterium]
MNVPKNSLKNRLKGSKPLLGLFNGLPSTYAAEITAGAGYDWVLIDGEHVPFDLPLILQQLQAVAAYDIPILVRPVEGTAVHLKQLLDIGVQSFLIPMVESKDQAEYLVQCIQYAPKGIRGVGTGLSRAAQWNRITSYMQEAEEEICLILQIESQKGLEQLEQIASIPRVDALFFGPSDLSASMGFLGQPRHPEVVQAIKKGIATIKEKGKAVGVFAMTPESIQDYAKEGVDIIALGADSLLLAEATYQHAQACKKLIEELDG